MVRTLDIYRRLIWIKIRSQLQYRTDFVVDVVANAITMLTFFLSLVLILQRFDSIGGWRLGEVAFLYGMVEFSFGMMDMIFSGFDPQGFGQRVRRGAFDQLLLRPIGVTVQVFGSEFIVRRLGRIIQGAIIFGIALSLVDITWSWPKLIYLPIVLVSLICFFGGLFIIGATITFWTIESIEAINIFTYGGSEMMAYPMHIYTDWLRQFFTYVIPAIFLNYYPALYFLDKPDPFNLPPFVQFLAPFAGIVVLAVALLFWQFGLKHYQSTGT
jgi:ABC-2 type transport system permease protein